MTKHRLPLRTGAENPIRWKPEEAPPTKLTWEQVREIRAMKRDRPDIKAREIAALYGVTPSNICCILRNKTWKEPTESLVTEGARAELAADGERAGSSAREDMGARE